MFKTPNFSIPHFGYLLLFIYTISGFDVLPAAPLRVPVDGFLNNVFPKNAPESTRPWRIEQAFPEGGVGGIVFDEPMGFIPVPNGPSLYVIGKKGLIWLMEDGFAEDEKQVALDLSSKTTSISEAGLQSIALHPEFGQTASPNRGYLYVIYTTALGGPPAHPSYVQGWRLSRYTVTDPDNSLIIDPSSELILVNQSTGIFHHGGALFFGPLDNFLYFSAGDGGLASNRQQIDRRLFSGVFRIDVDMNPIRSHAIPKQPVDGTTANYFIPNDNPFVGEIGALEEFYALGLRNPYRVTADRQTGVILAGDVGEASFEEINIILPGSNYQWPYREGLSSRSSMPVPLIGNDQAPIHVIGRGLSVAVIGGYTYRGSAYDAELGGHYIYSDLTSGIVYSLGDPQNGDTTVSILAEVPLTPPTNIRPGSNVAGFSEDENGELYLHQLDPNGKIFKIVKNDNTAQVFPLLLSQTGAFTDTANMVPSAALIPYEVNAPLWSDGALKKRWAIIPNDGAPYQPSVEQAVWTERYEWFFPAGTVFVKHFEIRSDDTDPSIIRRLETRFLVLDDEGTAYGVTYRWRPDHSDADLVDIDGLEEEIEIATSDTQSRFQTWTYPSTNQCMQCHTQQSRYVLGANTRQLNLETYYESTNTTQNQLLAWNEAGLIRNFAPADLIGAPALVSVDADVSLETKVRSYLDTNCSHCHQPGGVRALFDARSDTVLVAQGFINGRTAEVSSNTLLVPGDPAGSYMHERLSTLGPVQMPPIAKNILDDAGIMTLHDYILQLVLEDYLPPEWEQTELGTSFNQGLARFENGTFELGASGFPIGGTRDNALFVHQTIEGDFEMIAKVNEPSRPGSNLIMYAGLMARTDLTPGSPMYSVVDSGLERKSSRVISRQVQGASGPTQVTSSSNRPFQRLTRNGDTLRSYHSSDGVSWTLAHTGIDHFQGEALEVGMFLAGHTDAEEVLNSVTFEQVNLEAAEVAVIVVDAVAVENSSDDGELQFTRSGPLDGTLVLNLVWSGEAANSLDVFDLPATITFNPSENIKRISVDALADSDIDPAEALTVTITPDTRFALTSSNATVGIGESAFDAWRSLHYNPSELVDSGISGAMANCDNDEYVTIQEFFFGTNPNEQEGSVITVWIENNFLHLRYPRSIYASDLIFLVEANTTLETSLWSGATITEVSSQTIGTQELKTVRDIRPLSGLKAMYLRLAIKYQ